LGKRLERIRRGLLDIDRALQREVWQFIRKRKNFLIWTGKLTVNIKGTVIKTELDQICLNRKGTERRSEQIWKGMEMKKEIKDKLRIVKK
jgi:hypothetical protein